MSLSVARVYLPDDIQVIRVTTESDVRSVQVGVESPIRTIKVKGDQGDDGEPGSLIFVQSFEPATDEPYGSLWLDSDSAFLDLYQLIGGAWVDTGINLRVPPAVRVASGSITVDAETDDHILCDAGSATVQLPPSADRAPGRGILISDYGKDADSNAKTIVPDGAETILGLSSYVLNFRSDKVWLYPRADGAGWY